MVFVLAGRRTDPPDAPVARFPSSNVPLVKERLGRLYSSMRPSIHISAAAAGADLLALEAARDNGAWPLVVLPFEVDEFRRCSVRDRGPQWDARFLDLLPWLEREGKIVELDLDPDDVQTYHIGNDALVAHALQHAPPADIRAILVWEGVSRGEYDYTESFGRAAEKAGILPLVVSTLT